jgi:benzoyl-CoA reductase subunit C
MIDEFMDFNAQSAARMREIKRRTGKKMIGWTCNYVPVELIVAADMIPVRVLGRPDPIRVADEHLTNISCHTSRSYLDQLLAGDLDYLDGVVTPKVCDPLNYVHGLSHKHHACEECHYLQAPVETISEPSKIWWQGDVGLFKTTLEKWSGVEITPARMKQAIVQMNETRSLLQALYKLRLNETPPILGNEILQVVLAGMTCPNEEYNSQLRNLLDRLSGAISASEKRIRLMIIGSSIDFSELHILKEIEKTKGVFVADDTCTGSRWVYRDVADDLDPLKAIADRYHYSGFCAAKYPNDIRMVNIRMMADKYRVQGAVIVLEKYCEPFAFVAPATQKVFKDMGIPTLVIESAEATTSGQIGIRAQALFEIIEGY